MIEWSLNDESLRVALFRFVDVLPSLDSASDIGRHLEEYFARVDHALSGLAILAQALHAGTLVAPIVRRNVVKLARRFIAEESGNHLTAVLSSLRKEPAAFTLEWSVKRRSATGKRPPCSSAISSYCAGSPKLTATWPVLCADRRIVQRKNPARQFVGEAFVLVRALRSARPEH